MARILFITSNRIGDAVLSTAALEHAMANVPGASVVIACGPLPAPLFRATPGLERTVVFHKRPGRWRELWTALRRDRYDLAIDLRGSLLTWGLSARRRIVHRKSRILRHKLDELAALLRTDAMPPPRLHMDAAARRDAATLTGANGPVLALGAGANFIGKRWPPDRFSALARKLVGGEGPLRGLPVLLLGSPEDTAICAEIAAKLSDDGVTAIDAAGKLDLLTAAAALERAALFVGNDSGLMHMAATVGAPTLGLFGPSDERVYGPRGPRAMALRGPKSFEQTISIGYMPLIEHTLMDELSVEAVEAAARDLLRKGGLA
jgi:lipopolysaccharide export system permease protein